MKNIACNVTNAPEKAHFVSNVSRGPLFTMRVWKSFPCRGKLLSRILVQFPHILTTTMFALIKNVDYRKKKSFISAI